MFNRNVSHKILDEHTTIAWDLDETLINGKKSRFWRRWVLHNYQNRKFWIVTFRTGNMLDTIWEELMDCYDPLPSNLFQGIVSTPEILWNTWSEFRPLLRNIDSIENVPPNLVSLASYGKHSLSYIVEVNRAIRAWKAVECVKLGCTILVEDREDWCKKYCDHLNITFVNSLKD